MFTKLRSVVVLSLSLTAAAAAQDAAKPTESRAKAQDAAKPTDAAPQEATPTFPAQVEQVIVDVVVMDKKGNPVTDLTQADVTVTEDGTPQVITSFEKVALEPAPADMKVEKPRVSTNMRPENRTGRSFAVVFDDMHLTPFQSQRAKGAVTNFLETGTAAGDLVTLVATSGAAWWTTRMPQGRDELVATLKRLDGRYIPDTSPERMSDYEAMMIHVLRDSRTIERVNRRYDTFGVNPQGRQSSSNTGGNQTFGADADPQVTARAAEMYYSATSRNRSTLDTLERILNSLRSARGRKSLILVSEGFIYDPNLTEYREVVQAARRSNVAIYFLDTRGLTGIDHLQHGRVRPRPRHPGPRRGLLGEPRGLGGLRVDRLRFGRLQRQEHERPEQGHPAHRRGVAQLLPRRLRLAELGPRRQVPQDLGEGGAQGPAGAGPQGLLRAPGRGEGEAQEARARSRAAGGGGLALRARPDSAADVVVRLRRDHHGQGRHPHPHRHRPAGHPLRGEGRPPRRTPSSSCSWPPTARPASSSSTTSGST